MKDSGRLINVDLGAHYGAVRARVFEPQGRVLVPDEALARACRPTLEPISGKHNDAEKLAKIRKSLAAMGAHPDTVSTLLPNVNGNSVHVATGFVGQPFTAVVEHPKNPNRDDHEYTVYVVAGLPKENSKPKSKKDINKYRQRLKQL